MPTTYTPSPNPILSTISIPVDGDNANAASVNVSTTPLADMDFYLMDLFATCSENISPINFYTDDGATIVVAPVSGIVIYEVGKLELLSTTAMTIGVAELESGVAYDANSWYYIYLYGNAGVATFQLSKTPPDKFKLFKLGTTSFKYIGSVRSNSMSALVPVNKCRSKYTYLASTVLFGPTSSTSYVTVDAKQLVPPTSTLATMNFDNVNIGMAAGSLQYRRNASFSPISYTVSAAPSITVLFVENVVSSTQTFDIRVTNGNIAATIYVAGYQE